MSEEPLGLFDAYGIEMEYMLVDRDTLRVRPVVDQVLAMLAGNSESQSITDVRRGPITWSNELALHVLELKCSKPRKYLRRLPAIFETAIKELQPTLNAMNLQLLPTAVHPLMDPTKEAELWPHEGAEFYRTFDRIFQCRSHGWSNVQSVHLNLPFHGDEQFARLHAAVRIVLPLLPALAASSPILAGKYTGMLDTRMMLYSEHRRAMKSMTGNLIPEPVYDEASYRREILDPIVRDMQPHDPSGVMQADFLNARGAIARFDRGSIELRVMDVQEYPGADVAICAAVVSLVRALCEERWSSLEQQKQVPTVNLRHALDETSVQAERATLTDTAWLSHFGCTAPQIKAGELWSVLLSQLRRDDPVLDDLFAPLQIILENGTLATRICTALGKQFSPEALVDVYHEVAESLKQWEPFQP
jgi:glutamate---cysteine ligase / carboxylate-amine ligase